MSARLGHSGAQLAYAGCDAVTVLENAGAGNRHVGAGREGFADGRRVYSAINFDIYLSGNPISSIRAGA